MDISETEEVQDVLPANPSGAEDIGDCAGAEPEQETGQIAEEINEAPSAAPPADAPDAPDFTAIITGFTAQLLETNKISRERELVIDKLHQENQRLKQGELEQALLPVFRDLIRFYDDLGLTARKYAEPTSNDESDIVRDLKSYAETVTDILYRYGVERIPANTGDDFNPKEHKAVAIAPTDFEEQDRKISKIIREGFRTETKIVRNVEVEIHRYTAPSPPASSDAQTPLAAEEHGGQVSEAIEKSEVE